MLSVEKDSNVLDDIKEAVVPTSLSQKKSLTQGDHKSTDELEYMKEAVVTLCGKDSDKFEVKYKGSKEWFNLDIEFFKIYN